MTRDAFSSKPPDVEGDDTGSLRLGEFERRYESLFTEAMARGGEISWNERLRLDRAAAEMGLDAGRVARLEVALLEAWASEGEDTLANPSTLADRSATTGFPAAPTTDPLESEPPTLARPSQAPPAPTKAVADPFQELHTRFDTAVAQRSIDDSCRIAEVLVLRGVATADESNFWQAHRTAGPVRATHALDAEAWASLLRHPAQDRTTCEIFAVIASAVLVGRISAMRRDGTLPRLDPRTQQDPATSTLDAVRALGWAAATLGMRAPPVYVEPMLDVGYEIMPVAPPASRAGAHVLRITSPAEIAFACGRHLSWFREEQFVCTLVPSVAYLETIFCAALLIGEPAITLPPAATERARVVSRAIVPCLEPAQHDRLERLVTRFLAQGGRTNLRRWARAADWTACRAGLLLCGELSIAAGALATEPGGDARIEELTTFWASDAAGALRRKLGTAAV